ncbi:hypothetical protein DSO57_1025972 [Entomophthora muscae]|uniref:Uncharacterized protein n=1 Tax=Entomophthora muscae TaxID=34485 RepID=A0ACC2TDB6_9FUNG|nr:hypothetical protein DSO57_1025972 [Entomophthora muscae]
MANPRDSLILEKIKDFRVFSKEMPLIRNCYQFIKDNPRRANEFLMHLKTGMRNAPYLTIREPNMDMEAFDKELKATDTMRNLKDCLDSRRQVSTLENMQTLLMEIVLTSEEQMESVRFVIGYEIYRELKPKEIPSSEIGFVRKMLEVKTPITRKADDVVEVVVNTTLKELLGDTEDTFFQIDYSAIIDLEDVNVKISPILREYLKCKSAVEGVRFFASHQELLEIKYLRELYEQCYRYFLKGMYQEAKGLSVKYDVLKKSRRFTRNGF